MAGIGHRGFMGRKKERDCSSYLPGLYTVSELDQMVFVDGYIPVANATEFNNIRTGSAETMGAGTCWEDTYTTGGDKKYVQVLAIDFDGWGVWDAPIPIASNFVYDGNFNGDNMIISSITQEDGIFRTNSDSVLFRNLQIIGTFTATNIDSAICNNVAALINDIENVHYIGDINIHVTTKIRVGALFGGVLVGSNKKRINCSYSGQLIVTGEADFVSVFEHTAGNNMYHDCQVHGSVTAMNSDGVASIAYRLGNIAAQVHKNCVNYATINGDKAVGGIFGDQGGSAVTITDCLNFGDVNGGDNTGGIVSTMNTQIINCINYGDVSGLDYVGGITSSNGDTYKCVNYGKINGVNRVGGICGNEAQERTREECANFGEITCTGALAGGITGRITNTFINNCFVDCVINGSTQTGGIYGGGFGGIVTNCLSIATGNLQGISGQNTGTVTDTYWDTTIGPPTSFKGTGYSTVNLQTPTSNTGIYANYDPAIWDFGTSSEYPKLINTP